MIPLPAGTSQAGGSAIAPRSPHAPWYHRLTMFDGEDLQLPLLLCPRVLFPCTELRVPLDGALLRDLLLTPPERRWLGVVLAVPRGAEIAAGIYPAGTVSRVLDLEPAGTGSRVRLLGARRFRVATRPEAEPYPRALVRLLPEPHLDERSPALVRLRRELEERLAEARRALGPALPLPEGQLRRLRDAPFEELVNRVATALDVPELRQLELLALSAPERAIEIAGILRSRIKLMALLGPYRHLAGGAEAN
jgi:hypothetical protein